MNKDYQQIKEILDNYEKSLMKTYANDGCITSAITEIIKGKVFEQLCKLIDEIDNAERY